MSSSYKLAKQVDGIGFYAEVTVNQKVFNAMDETHIVFADNAFQWLKEVYGENFYEWKICNQYRKEALLGVSYALKHIQDSSFEENCTVVISEIRAHPAQTPEGAVSYASYFATCKLLDFTFEEKQAPQICNGKVVFP